MTDSNDITPQSLPSASSVNDDKTRVVTRDAQAALKP